MEKRVWNFLRRKDDKKIRLRLETALPPHRPLMDSAIVVVL